MHSGGESRRLQAVDRTMPTPAERRNHDHAVRVGQQEKSERRCTADRIVKQRIARDLGFTRLFAIEGDQRARVYFMNDPD
jgi:hypothetical protein